ncbi:MAG: 23S rRNA (guanosine(2251)-2'-O)-methyltransferase RlmB [Clostridia bacterium]|nr:23S rRNA (guanosine(2251)-2'-O)-methyltransferase RlmB [Clostridia bacterium]
MKNNAQKGKTTGRNPARKKYDAPRPEKKREEPKNEDSENMVYGRNPVMETIRSGRTVDKLFVAKGEREGSIVRVIAMAREKGITVVEAEKAKLDSMTRSSSHQGVVAITTEFSYCEPEDILAYAEEKGEKPFLLVIDGINDPRNLGAIIRTADAAGVHGIILPKRGACGLTATVYKTAAGACEYMKIARVVNIPSAIEFLKEKNVWIYGTDGDAPEDIYSTDLTGAAAIVMGDEGSGLSRLVRERCDRLIKIPMAGRITSLNISVAAAVAMYEKVRQDRR